MIRAAALLAALQPASPLAVLSTAPWAVLPFARPTAVFTEVAPVLLTIPASLAGGAGCPPLPAPTSLAVYMSTGYVGLCVANASALPVAPGAPPLGFDLASCSVPFSGESWRSWPPAAVPAHSEWLRNYDGVMAAVPTGGSLLLVRHGEHKNELCWGNDLLYQGTINADVDARNCFSGYHNTSGFSDCQAAYNALTTGALLPFSAATCYGLGEPGNASAVDLGPLAWPVDGYLNASGGKAGYGVRQPSAVAAWDGAVMLGWIDNGFDTADIWFARAPPPPAPLGAASFFSFNHASRAWDLPTLPAGFAARNFAAFLRSPSPAGAPGSGGAPAFPLAPDAGSVHVAAARLTVGGAPTNLHLIVYDVVNYTQCYDGSAATQPAGEGAGTRTVRGVLAARRRARAAPGGGACVPPWRLFLRTTADFVDFSAPVELADYAAPGWGAARLAYPTLVSADGARNDEVDAGGFYVVGTCAQDDAACGSTDGPQVTAARVVIAV